MKYDWQPLSTPREAVYRLLEADGPMPTSAIAEATHLSENTVLRVLRLLMVDGLVEKGRTAVTGKTVPCYRLIPRKAKK